MSKKLLFIIFIITPPLSHSQAPLKDDVSNFMEDKFNLYKYEEFEFSRIEWDKEFDPDTITIDESQEFSPSSIDIESFSTDDSFELNKQQTQSTFDFNITDKQWAIINDIPLLKTSEGQLVESRIDNNNHLLIKYTRPNNTTVSYKQVAFHSLTESSVKTPEKVKKQADFIKRFNRASSDKDYIDKSVIYVPLLFNE